MLLSRMSHKHYLAKTSNNQISFTFLRFPTILMLRIITNLPHIFHVYRLVSVQSTHYYCCSLNKNCFWIYSHKISPSLGCDKNPKRNIHSFLRLHFTHFLNVISNLFQYISHYVDHSVLSEACMVNPCNRDILK